MGANCSQATTECRPSHASRSCRSLGISAGIGESRKVELLSGGLDRRADPKVPDLVPAGAVQGGMYPIR